MFRILKDSDSTQDNALEKRKEDERAIRQPLPENSTRVDGRLANPVALPSFRNLLPLPVLRPKRDKRTGPFLRNIFNKRGTNIYNDYLTLEGMFVSLPNHGVKKSFVTPPSLWEMIDSDDIYYHLWVAVDTALTQKRSVDLSVKWAYEQFIVELGTALLDIIPGQLYTFIDSRLGLGEIVETARSMMCRFELKGCNRKNIVLNIPATQEGIQAARILTTEHGMKVNLLFVSSLMHAVVCADAGATSITVHVGQILTWHENRLNQDYHTLTPHPGIETIQAVIEFMRHHKLQTEVFATNPRSLIELQALDGLHGACLSRAMMEQLASYKVPHDTNMIEDAESLLRARQVQYPLPSDTHDNFMKGMSPQSKRTIDAILGGELCKMNVVLDNIEDKIRELVEARMEIDRMPLEELEQKRRVEGEWRKGRRQSISVSFPTTVDPDVF
ncbi:aldolase [Rickenella mellea]|uniref:Aldolase n=1 Tax=Rickenella mellea TaxID=50990 RepID=A0A4Y7QJU2_9AGAM|nr:aldolase [Rickenella mellea]